MKRFKINFTVKGEETDLLAEPMDLNNRMYSLERQLTDPHPLLIERGENDTWRLKSQDDWSLSEEDINELGRKLDREYESSPQV